MRWLIALAALAQAASSQAQDYIPYLDIYAGNMIYGRMLESNLGIKDEPSPPARGAATRPTNVGGPAYLRNPARLDAAPLSFAYDSTPALRRAAADSYVDRVRKSNAAAGVAIADQIAKNDFSRVYAGIVQPFGYRGNDAADALAAYTLLGWLIATGAPDPTPAQARAVRTQIAQAMATNAGLSGANKRAELGENLKLLFVTLHAGWQSARREGNLNQYSDGVNGMFRKFSGNDLRALRLTDRGLVPR